VEEAINALAAYDGTAADKDLKVWLVRLLVRFVESIRLNAIADRPLDGPDTGLTSQLVSLIKKWQKLCNLLLAAANDVVQDPETMARRFQAYAGVGVHNAFELAAALGMVLISNSGRRRQKRSVQDNQDHAVAGLTLVEVADVIVHNIDGEDQGDLYGVIAVDDGSGSQRLFDRDRSDVQSVRPGEQAEITGPGRAVSVADGFAVSFDLMDRDTDLSPDDEVVAVGCRWCSSVAIDNADDVLRDARRRPRFLSRENSGSELNAGELWCQNVAPFSLYSLLFILSVYRPKTHDHPPHALALRRARLTRGNALHARRGGDHTRLTVNAARFRLNTTHAAIYLWNTNMHY
jgi:hypothetical protein